MTILIFPYLFFVFCFLFAHIVVFLFCCCRALQVRNTLCTRTAPYEKENKCNSSQIQMLKKKKNSLKQKILLSTFFSAKSPVCYWFICMAGHRMLYVTHIFGRISFVFWFYFLQKLFVSLFLLSEDIYIIFCITLITLNHVFRTEGVCSFWMEKCTVVLVMAFQK